MSSSIGNPFALIANQYRSDRAEYTKIILLFGYLFFVVSASTLSRTAADTLFLSRFDASALSYMYLPQALTLLVSGFIYQKLCGRYRTDQLVVGVIAMASLLAITSRVAVGIGYDWVFPVIYVGYDVLNFLMIVCFWQFATSIMDQRKAKRTIGWVGSGGLVGGILSGFGLKLLVQPLGTENLIIIYAVAQLLCLVFVLKLMRGIKNPSETFAIKPASKTTSSKTKVKENQERQGLFRSVPHLKYVAIMAGTLVISLTLIDYQFKVILRGSLQNEELAGFMGSFYGFAGILALIVQLFVSGKLITRFGVMTAILVFPVLLFTGSLALLIMPVLAVATAVKASDKVLGDTIYSSVSQLIMFPIPPEWRGKAKGFLDGIVRNGAKGIAAISLIALSQWFAVEQFSYFILALIAGCIFAAVKIKKTYLTMLLSTLQSKGMDLQDEPDFVDPASIQILTSAMYSKEKQEALYAFSILSGIREFDMFAQLERLLEHPVREMRIEALKFVQSSVPIGGELKLEPLLADPVDTEVRAHAILALSAYAREEQLDRMIAYLEHSEVPIRAAAIVGLVKYYGIEGMFHAVGVLKQLLESDHEEERKAMASLFGQIGIQSFYKPLIPMLRDSSPFVRIRALESAALLRVPELVPSIVPLLRDSKVRQQAVAALQAYDEAVIIPLLEPYLIAAESNLHLPRVLEKVGTQAALDSLLRHYRVMSAELREKILESATRLHAGLAKVDMQQAEQLISFEITTYWDWTGHSQTLARTTVTAELSEALEQMRMRHIGRIFRLLAFLYDAKAINAVYTSWTNGNARQQANAIEVVDQLLAGKLRADITRIISSPIAGRNESSSPALANQALDWFYELGDSWINRNIEYLRASEEQRVTDKLMNQVQLLKKVSLFSELTGRDLFNIAQQLQTVEKIKGTTIVRQGDIGDSLYLIERGTAGIYIDSTCVKVLGAYDYFGEMSVITHKARSASVIAEEDVTLYELTSNAFYEIIFDRTEIAMAMMKLLSLRLRSTNEKIASTAAEADREIAAADGAALDSLDASGKNETMIRRILVLQKISLFAHCSQEDFVALAQMTEESVYEPGEKVCSVGDDGDTLYGIIDGAIQVHKGPEKLAMLGIGQIFGEMALIDGQPRSADCTAIRRTVLLELTREQAFAFCFQKMHILKGLMRVLAERTQDTERLA
ncbi:Npt1/Npt2 family nucleotide transporter [Cohnella herbarum]|uniref:ADP,ATP carrier protein n=1 Tax=Cohnella herbarum TaxID=2728023 RepID=A0A7Z2VN09_9BACL|nr:Npt1/Npt2 family nucleotide transporter [Cohnella herbarum]QJD86067.1 cyclic nucleotide-binding domain-containing protein [Cohnella herbarum]